MRSSMALAMSVACLIGATPAGAEGVTTDPSLQAAVLEPEPGPPAPPDRLVVNRKLTGSFILVGSFLWIASDRLWQDTLAPKECRIICESKVNPFDRILGDALLWNDTDLPQTLSDLASYVAIPAIAFGGLSLGAFHDRNGGHWVDDMLIVAEPTVVQGLINRIAALSFGRTRPRTRSAPPGSPLLDDRQAYESFFSGHSSAAFSLGMSAATVASMRHYRVAPWLYVSTIVFGGLNGYMRLAGGDHYVTDVLVGTLVATIVGISWPKLHRRTAGPHLEATPVRDGATLSLSGSW